jgi:hypothetical protein
MEDGKQLSDLTVRVIVMRNGNAESQYAAPNEFPLFSLFFFFSLLAEIFEICRYFPNNCYSDIMAL